MRSLRSRPRLATPNVPARDLDVIQLWACRCPIGSIRTYAICVADVASSIDFMKTHVSQQEFRNSHAFEQAIGRHRLHQRAQGRVHFQQALCRLAGKDAVGNAQGNLFDGPADSSKYTKVLVSSRSMSPGLESVPLADARSSCSIS